MVEDVTVTSASLNMIVEQLNSINNSLSIMLFVLLFVVGVVAAAFVVFILYKILIYLLF